ncbi:MAG: DUF3565 domain-containing protein [Gemmatimonadota bacterium]
MNQPIKTFHQDHEQHWVAELACGHSQHVRHEPPLMTRTWVLTPEGRASHLGTTLDCSRCDEEDAGIRGLCEEGAEEVRVRPAK